MSNLKSTKKALLSSVLALFLCFAMLLGTTFAWFSDTASSTGNVIKTGTLNVEMYYADGSKAVPTDENGWLDASEGAIFNNDKWEPGYSEAKHLLIANEGSLALKYQMRILASGVVSVLANVIDVYYFDEATQLTRDSFTDANRLGTLSEVLNVTFLNNLSNTVSGTLKAGESKAVTLALKMQEEAKDEYQGLSLGSDFSIQILATQYTSEKDSFGDQYDAGADFAPQEIPAAMVYAFSKDAASKVNLVDMNGNVISTGLDTAYSFQPTETLAQALASDYSWGHADFFVYADSTVPANSMMLAGYYSAFGDYIGLTESEWIGLSSDVDVKAGADNGIRLLRDGLFGTHIAYNEICEYGNDGTGFLCGAADLTGENEGTTLYVELRVYKVDCAYSADPSHHHNSLDCETGEYVTIGQFEYTFGGEYVTTDDGSVLFLADDGEIVLSDTQDVAATTYVVPDGVTSLGNYSFSYTDTIEEVIVSDTVTSLGRAFDSNTTIKKVVLNEGLETIDSRAFRSTTALEEVVIPSTVTTIADNAFQKSYIKTITIPATVETIGEAAFGASKIETVIFEGNTSVQGYAFRGCPNLRTVIMYGDDVTFIPSTLNGRNSTWFCNNESNNPNVSDIDFHVANETVKARVLTAMGAEAGNTDVFVMKTVSDSASLADAIANANTEANGGTTVVLVGAGDYTFPSNLSSGVVLNCEEGTVFEGKSGLNVKGATVVGATFSNVGDTAVGGTVNGTFKDCTFEGAETLRWCYVSAGETVVFENCVINTTFRGIHFDEMNGTAIFKNCEINGFNAYSGTGHIYFEGCTFGCDESRYNGLNIYSNTTLTNCTFNYTSGKTNFIDMEGTEKTLTINGCVAYLDGTQIDVTDMIGGSELANNTVIVDGVELVNQ